MTAITEVARAIASLRDSDNPEDLDRMEGAMQALREAYNHLRAEAEEVKLEFVQRAGGRVELGERVYIASKDRRWVPRLRPGESLGMLLSETGGDVDAIGAMLSASAWKQGAVRKATNDVVHAAMFRQEVTDTVSVKAMPKEMVK